MKESPKSAKSDDGFDWRGYAPWLLFAGAAVLLLIVVAAVAVFWASRGMRPASEDEKTVLKHLEKEYDAKYKLDDKGRVFRVELEGPHVDDEAIEWAVKLKQLKELSLWKSSISDNGLDKLRELKRLEHLGLMDTRISDAGLRSLEKMPSLRDIWVSENERLTRQGVTSLKNTLPGLRVHGLK